MKRVIVLGSTGSIGKSTLDILRRQRDDFNLVGISAYSNADSIEEQVEDFEPEYISVVNKESSLRLKKKLNSKCTLLEGEEGLAELASKPCDILVLGITGLAALKPLLACLGKTKRLLLANKEAVVSGGKFIMDKINDSKTELFPVDSEAWAVFRLLQNRDSQNLENIYITASGGPFLDKDKDFIQSAGVKETLSHPVWDMGKQITVNSASLMNKGFEVIEVSHLFGVDLNKIKVLVHPQSVVHALVRTKDGSLFSSMFQPDMKIPISYGLNYPDFKKQARDLDLTDQNELNFLSPDLEKFPALSLAYKVGKRGGNLLTILTIADEEAVELFLEEKIMFTDIYRIVSGIIEEAEYSKIKSVDDIFYWQEWTKDKVKQIQGQ